MWLRKGEVVAGSMNVGYDAASTPLTVTSQKHRQNSYSSIQAPLHIKQSSIRSLQVLLFGCSFSWDYMTILKELHNYIIKHSGT